MKIECELPQIIEVDDYHEFGRIEYFLKRLNKDIKINEVGFVRDYIGIIYVGSLEDEENKVLFDKLKEEVREFDEDWKKE